MQKFTVFTVLLTILVVVVAAETFVNKYLPALSDDGGASVLEADGSGYSLPDELDLSEALMDGGIVDSGIVDGGIADDPIFELEPVFEPVLELEEPLGDGFLEVNDGGIFDIEDFSDESDVATPGQLIREDQVVNAGFVGAYLVEEDHDGYLYKTINIGDLYGVDVAKHAITNGTTTYVKVYSISTEDLNQIDNVYNVLKVRAAEGTQSEVNSTNEFGSSSFYMNDARRESVAFLTSRVGSRIYGFSYPKQYHPQIRSLISILMLDGR
jgi:hypothetical protein